MTPCQVLASILLHGFVAYHALGSQGKGLFSSKTWTVHLIPGDVGLENISALFSSFSTPIFGIVTEPK